MARAVIVTFKSNADAERYVRDVIEREGVNVLSDDPDLYSDQLKAEIGAVVAVPTKACQCGIVEDTGRRRRRSKRESGWTRSKHYGWWICGHCNKPSRPVITHWITGMLHGANDLLDEILGTGGPISSVGRWKRDGGADRSDGGSGRPEMRVGDHFEHY